MPKGKKYGGRKKGTPNKITNDMRKVFAQWATDNADVFDDLFRRQMADIDNMYDSALKIKLRSELMKLYLEMNKFVVPSLTAVDINDVTEDANKGIVDKLKQASEDANK